MASGTSAPPVGFEGPEKVLELDFVPGKGPEEGLFAIPSDEWKGMLKHAACGVLSIVTNEHFHSYVLSESSMFVYRHKVIIKTCGTTTLLAMLPHVERRIKELGMDIEWLAFSRKDFSFPAEQKFPHRGIQEEVSFLQAAHPQGSAYVLGPITGDHWMVFVADYCERPSAESTDCTLNVMMYDIDPSVAAMFQEQYEGRTLTAAEVTSLTRIDTLLPGSTIQDVLFQPCGYSMNGLLGEAYWTIHVTPESHCSYASFETNVTTSTYTPLLRAVLGVFMPARYSVTLFADKAGLEGVADMPFHSLVAPPLPDDHPAAAKQYVLTAKSRTEFAGDYCSVLGNYTLADPAEIMDPVTGGMAITTPKAGTSEGGGSSSQGDSSPSAPDSGTPGSTIVRPVTGSTGDRRVVAALLAAAAHA